MASSILDALAVLAETPRRIAPQRSIPSPSSIPSNTEHRKIRPPPPPSPTISSLTRRYRPRSRQRDRARSTSPIHRTRDRNPHGRGRRRRSLSPSSRVIPAPLSARRTVGTVRRLTRRFFSNHPFTRSYIADNVPAIVRTTKNNTLRNTAPPPRGNRVPYLRRPPPGLTDRNHGDNRNKDRGVIFADDVSLVRYIIDHDEDEDRLVSSERIPLRGGDGERRRIPRRIRAPPPPLGSLEEND